jgi:hypothetical protein
MDINALGPDWENAFIRGIAKLKNEELKRSFKRGFAKSVLGHLDRQDYEKATRWDFDSVDEFRAHLDKYWNMFYPSENPEDALRP